MLLKITVLSEPYDSHIILFKAQDFIELKVPVDLSEEGRGKTLEFVPVTNVLTLINYLFGPHGIRVSQRQLDQYWEHAAAHFEWAKGGQHPGYTRRSVPLSVYGDEARYIDQGGFVEKVVVILLSCPLFAPRSTRNGRWPIFCCRESLTCGIATINEILKYISWCMNVVQCGVKPAEGFRGTHVPPEDSLIFSGLTFALTEVRGDWSWHCFSLNLKSRWNSNAMCWKCPATSKTLNGNVNMAYATTYSEEASWIPLQYSNVQFINSQLKNPLCLLANTLISDAC